VGLFAGFDALVCCAVVHFVERAYLLLRGAGSSFDFAATGGDE
jgi:hypothetical protein